MSPRKRGSTFGAGLLQLLGYQQITQITQIPGAVDVRVRAITTLTNERMLTPLGNLFTRVASLARKSRIDLDGLDSGSRRLNNNHFLKLMEGPAVQASAHTLSCLDAVTNVREVFKADNADALFPSFFDDLFADDVVDVLHVTPFSARSLAEVLFGTP